MSRKIFFAIVAALLGSAAGVIYYGSNPSLTPYIERAAEYDVTILRDTWGVPHIYGKRDADTAFGLAYAHAEDDFKTTQETLIMVRGMNGYFNGPGAAATDYLVHLLDVWDTIESKYETDLSPETRAICDAYADGLNYYAALHPDELASRGLLPFRGEDVVAGFVFRGPFFFGLDREIGELFGDERRHEISTKGSADAEARNGFDAILAAGDALFGGADRGSNTFAVAPSRTDDGSTFLNINSHQPWEGMVSWWEAHLVSEEGWDMVGGVFPGAPVVLHGHNRNLGWAHTVNRPDLIDIYVLDVDPNNPDRYKYEGEWVDFEKSEAAITVKLWGPIRWTVTREVLRSVHGPAVRQSHGTYAIRFAGDGEVRQVEQWYRMNKSANFDEWMTAMKIRAIPSLNTAYGGQNGHIAYIYNALFPKRAEGYDWEKYLPGHIAEVVWDRDDPLPFDALPNVIDPESGWVQNCNSTPFQTSGREDNPKPEDYSPTLGIETHMTNRGLRAVELLAGDESITWDEFYTYKHDMQYAVGSFVSKSRARILEVGAPDDDPLLQKAVEALRRWDLRCNAENTGAAIGVLTFQPLYGRGSRDDITVDDLLAALRKTAENLQAKHGTLEPKWSDVNRMHRGDLDLGLGGGPDVLRAVSGRIQDDGATTVGQTGDSYVLMARWLPDGSVDSISAHQYGNATLDQSSPHYADQAQELFTKVKMKPVWMDEEKIRANLEAEYRPGEELTAL